MKNKQEIVSAVRTHISEHDNEYVQLLNREAMEAQQVVANIEFARQKFIGEIWRRYKLTPNDRVLPDGTIERVTPLELVKDKEKANVSEATDAAAG